MMRSSSSLLTSLLLLLIISINESSSPSNPSKHATATLSLIHILNTTRSIYKLTVSYPPDDDVDEAVKCGGKDQIYELTRLRESILIEHERYAVNMITTSEVPENVDILKCVLLPSLRDVRTTRVRSVSLISLGETYYKDHSGEDHLTHREDFMSYIEIFAHVTKTSLKCREKNIECAPKVALRDLVRTLTSSNVTDMNLEPSLGRLCPLSSIPFGHARYLPGRLRWLRREYVTLPTSSIVGSLGGLYKASRVTPLLVYGWKSEFDFDRIWLGSDPLRNFTLGEVVQLRDFERDGNVGLFVIASFPSERTIRLTELPSGMHVLSLTLDTHTHTHTHTYIQVYLCLDAFHHFARRQK